MINITSPEDCCGCCACEQVCPKAAITMQEDCCGFMYPQVSSDLCVHCGLCEQVCPLRQAVKQRMPKKTYAVKHKDEHIRGDSSSGGVFSALCEEVLSRGGVVYGAVFDEQWKVRHERIDSSDDIARLRGSKYVQSDMRGIYARVKDDLKQEIPVLFSGTHCHIAALKRYLRKDYDLLTTVDVVCGGVPSPRLWREYLAAALQAKCAEEKRKDIRIHRIRFRDKAPEGWNNFHLTLSYNTQAPNAGAALQRATESLRIWENPYSLAWLKGFIRRPSCSVCPFRCGGSGADYTMADYWCVEQHHPDLADDRGVSILMCYNAVLPPKSIRLLCDYKETHFEWAANGQTCLLYNHPRNPLSGMFYFLYLVCRLPFRYSLFVCLAGDKIRQVALKQRNFLRKLKRRIWQLF